MKPFLKRWGVRSLFLPPVVIGVAIVAVAAASVQGPVRESVQELARPMTVQTLRYESVTPTVTTFGEARPAQVWTAIARGDGQITATHPNLDAGSVVRKGEVLLQIDTEDYRLGLERIAAEIDSLSSQIRETERRAKNDEANLEIEEASLKLATRESTRQARLHARNAIGESQADQAERNRLQQAKAVQQMRNSLALVPSQLERLKASRLAAQKQLAQAELDLAETTIKAPFDGRLATVSTEEGQYVARNERLFELHAIGRIEVDVRLAIDDVEVLVSSTEDGFVDALSQCKALIHVESGGFQQTLSGEVARVQEVVDQQTRTLGLVIQASDAAARLPLLDGMFCRVELLGERREQQLVAPASVVRDGSVYVVDDDNRLQRRDVEIAYRFGSRVAFHSGVTSGDRVVVSDPSPSVVGSLIDPIDRETGDRLDQGSLSLVGQSR